MPLVVREGGIEFIIHTRELPFEPPHVHVRFAGQEVRIELYGGTFMEEPPEGMRKKIRELYAKYSEKIYAAWLQIHNEGGR